MLRWSRRRRLSCATASIGGCRSTRWWWVEQVVVGDLVRLAAGDQVVADGTVVSAGGLAPDEANLTGESDSAVWGPGEPVWSGSFVVEIPRLVLARASSTRSVSVASTICTAAF